MGRCGILRGFIIIFFLVFLINIVCANIESPLQTNFLTNGTIFNSAFKTAYYNNYLYVLTYNYQFVTLDISNPSQPKQVSYLSNSSSINGAYDMLFYGNLVYTVAYTSQGLATINISNPLQPKQVNFFTNSSSLKNPVRLARKGNYLYALSYSNSSLITFDISIPQTPIQIDRFYNATSLNVPFQIIVVGDYAYVASDGSNSLTTFDLSDPTKPKQINHYINASSINMIYNFELSADSQYLYAVSNSNNNIIIFNISNPTSPTQIVNFVNLSSINGATGIVRINDYLYVSSANNKSLVTFKLDNPLQPQQINFFTNSSSLSLPKNIAEHNGYLYIPDQSNNGLTTFFIFLSIGNPNILSPMNQSFINEVLNITYNVIDNDTPLFSCSLYVDGKLNMTNNSVNNNTNSVFLPSFIEGYHTFYVNCSDTVSIGNSALYNIYFDASQPVFHLNAPSFLNTTIYDTNINILGNITDNSLYRVNETIFAPNSSIFYNNYSGDLPANTTFYDLSTSITSWYLPEGIYTYYLEAVDSHTSKYFDEEIKSEEKEKDKEYLLDLKHDDVTFKLGNSLGIKFIKDFDRIKFEFDGKTKKEKKQFSIQPSELLIKIQNSEYPCHYVFGHYWFDCAGLENPTENLDKEKNLLTIDFDMSTDTAITDSLGGLNENNLSLSFEILHCQPDWIAQYGACQANNSMLKYYTDNNSCDSPLDIPTDNNTYVDCGYCQQDITIQYTSSCYHNDSETDIINVSYIDNNYYACCAITGLYEDCWINFTPYNETFFERCYLTQNNFIVKYDENADFGLGNDKIFWAINLNDSNNAYKCTSYVITEEGRLIQTNPVYTKQSDTLIKFRDTNYEDREFFNIENGIGNVYFTKENLIFDGRDYVFGAQCAGNNQTLKSERWVKVGYENLNAPVTRSVWSVTQMGVIILIIIGGMAILFIIAVIINFYKKSRFG
jgi:hypothetical protein